MDTMEMHVEDLVRAPRSTHEAPIHTKRPARSKRATVTELDYGTQRERLLQRARMVKDEPAADPHAGWIVEYWEAMDAACEARNAADKILFSIRTGDRNNPDVLRSSGHAEAEAKASALEDGWAERRDKIIKTTARTHDGLLLQLGFIVSTHEGSELGDDARGRLTRIAYELLNDHRPRRADDHLLALWEEIKADSKLFNDNPSEDDKEFTRVSDAIGRKEKRMSRMSPTTAAGALAMMELFKELEGKPFAHVRSDDIWSRVTAYLEKQVAAERAGSALHHFYKNLAAYEQRSAADQPQWMGLPDPDRPEPILELVRQMNDFMVLCHRSDYAEKIQKDNLSESRKDAATKLGLDAHTALLMAALSRAAQTPDGAIAQVCLLEGAVEIAENWDDERAAEAAFKAIRACLYSLVNALERLIGKTREDVTFHSNFLSRVHDPFNIPSFDQLPDNARAVYDEVQTSLLDTKLGRRRKSQLTASSAVATMRAA